MRQIAFILLIIISIFGCNNKQKEIQEQESIEKICIDSLARIAWGDALFGMSLKEALNTNALKGSDISKTDFGQVLNLPPEKRNIGNINTDIMSLCAFFEKDKLCHVFIKSYPLPAPLIDDLEDDAIRIADKFEKKYGKPIESLDKKVSILDFNRNEPIRLRKWTIGENKTIYIELREEENGGEYYYDVSISGSKYSIDKNIERALKEIGEEGEELDEYQF